MKRGLVIVLAAAAGCATAQPLVLSDAQVRRFADTVREAEAAGIADGPPEALRMLEEAKSGFEYGQRLPRYPERAKEILAKAQQDADAALALVREAAKARELAAAEARRKALEGTAEPPDEQAPQAPQVTAAAAP
jgi:hypothetical protein